MTKENSSDQTLLNFILEELQQANQQLAIQQDSLKYLRENLRQPVANDFPERKIEELKSTLELYHARLLPPIHAKFKHIFLVHISTVIAFTIFTDLVVILWLYMNKSAEVSYLTADAIKYRHLKLSANPTLSRLLAATDSLYLFNPSDFEKEVRNREFVLTKTSVPLPASGRQENLPAGTRPKPGKKSSSK